MPDPSPHRRRGFLDLTERLGNKLPEPAILFVFGCLVVMLLSQWGASRGWMVQPKALVPLEPAADVAPGGLALRADNSSVPPGGSALRADDSRPQVRLVDRGDPIPIRGLLSGDGLYWAISSMVDNFVRFPPLGVVLVGILGVGIAERTGFIGALLKAIMLIVPRRLLTPFVVFLGVNSSMATDAGYIVLPPVAAALFKAAGRSPIAGIAAVFAGIAGGFNANLLITSLDPLLAGLTQPAARTIDPGYAVSPACNWYFMIVSTFMLTFVGWAITSWLVEPRLSRRTPEEGGPSPGAVVETPRLERDERRGLLAGVAVTFVLTGVFWSFTAIPKAPFDVWLRHDDGRVVTRGELAAIRDGSEDPRVRALAEGPARGLDLAPLLAGDASADKPVRDPRRRLGDAQRNNVPGTADAFDRWVESIVPMLFVLFLTPGVVYGAATGSIRKGKDVVAMFVDSMASMAPVIVLSFFAAQFIEYFKYSNLDKMLAYAGGSALASAALPPTLLVLALVVGTMLINLLIASMSAKYAMLAPIIVPMLMLVGISPELTQGAYRIGDSVTNIITPMNAYLVIILVCVQRHDPKAGMGTLIATMLPYTAGFLLCWCGLIVGWILLGIPLGPDGPLTYSP